MGDYRKVIPVGGSWAIVIPKETLLAADLTVGDYARISLAEKKITIQKPEGFHPPGSKKGR